MFFNFVFSGSQQKFVDLGFGSVADGLFGQFANISTQAVFDLFKNVDKNILDPQSIVEISTTDVESHCIPQRDDLNRQSGNDAGENMCLINDMFLFFCVL